MAWVDLELKCSHEYKGGHAAFVADRFPRSFDPTSFFFPVGTTNAVGCLYSGRAPTERRLEEE